MCISHQPNPSSFQSPSPDLAAIVSMLNEAAQALLHLHTAPGAAPKAKAQATRQDEIRCYRFPRLAIRCEQELFEDQGAEDLRDVLFNASSSLTAFSALLEHIDPEAKLEGMTLHMLARELKRVEDEEKQSVADLCAKINKALK